MTQPTALRLAEYHECAADLHSIQTAAELRRLHEANEAFGKRQEWWNERMFVLEQQRDALLEALMKLEYSSDGCIKRYPEESEVNAAIKKAEENT